MRDAKLPPLAQVDPKDAWQPWQPTAEQPWDLKWAAHLYRRAGFGAPAYQEGTNSWDRLQQAVAQGVNKTLDEVLNGLPGQADFAAMMDELGPRMTRTPGRFQFGEDQTPGGDLQAWWLYRCYFTPHPLQERLTLFWHNHFATSIAKVKRPPLMLRQNQLLRKYALGSFRPLLLEMSRDPAMLVWLDSNSNVKGKANENYAREVMELFSLGVGNYTEADIREAARAFTGWHTTGSEFLFNAPQHDAGPKTVLKQTGPWDGGDVVRILLEQPVCARFLVRKLYRELISEAEVPPVRLIEPLAEQLRTTDYDVGGVVRTMLRSRLFFSDHAYRQRVKCPVEFVIGLARTLEAGGGPAELAKAMADLGQQLFAPPNVKGWVGGKAWLNSATLLARHNLANRLVHQVTDPQAQFRRVSAQAVEVVQPAPGAKGEKAAAGGIAGMVEKHGGKGPDQQTAFLLDLFLQGNVAGSARAKLVDFLKGGEPKPEALHERVRETAHTILLMPEYQLA